jgi:2-polyprenyl-3-methyl-5-hydroxy-6-metoxy-1,4-benzoquinol methylase
VVVSSISNEDLSEQILSKLDDLTASLLSDGFIQEASKYSSINKQDLKEYISVSLEEARHTLALIRNYDMQDKRVLEFGAGLGIASIALYLAGVEVVAFEPGGLGFEKNYLMNEFIKKYFNFEFQTVNDINVFEQESFDIIFSNNVLEHVQDPDEVLQTLNLIMNKEGVMVHNVPNYLIPYEPHFAIPFFPIFPKKTSCLIPKKITTTGLWRSINFINYFDIKRIAKQNNVKIKFRKGLLYPAFNRLVTDVEYGKRHQFLTKVARISSSLKLLNVLKYFPAYLSTPMVFEWKK